MIDKRGECIVKGPDGRYLFGAVKVGERGQIVIPKEARDVFGIKPGDMMLMAGDDNGMAMVKLDVFQDIASSVLSSIPRAESTKEENKNQ